MKYFLTLFIIFFSVQISYSRDIIHLAINEKSEVNEAVIKENNNSLEEPIILQEESQTPQKIVGEIEYNYINETTPLLSKYTSLKFDKGIVETFEPFMVYQGNFNFNFVSDDEYHTEYQNPLLDLNIKGKFKEAPIEYYLQYNLYPKSGHNYFQTFFKDHYLKFKYIPNNDIYVGHFKVPIGVEGCANNYTMPFINQSQIARNFAQVRAVGAKVMGNYKYADYTLAVTSSDRYFHQFFPGAEFSGWVDLKPLGATDGKYGELKIGGGVNIGRREDAYKVISTAISYKYKKIGAFAEYAFADGSNGSTGFSTNRAQGAVVTLTYNLTKKIQLLARYDIFNSNMDLSNKIVTEYTAGINYFIKGSSAKIILNYIYRNSELGENSHRFLVGTQFIL